MEIHSQAYYSMSLQAANNAVKETSSYWSLYSDWLLAWWLDLKILFQDQERQDAGEYLSIKLRATVHAITRILCTRTSTSLATSLLGKILLLIIKWRREIASLTVTSLNSLELSWPLTCRSLTISTYPSVIQDVASLWIICQYNRYISLYVLCICSSVF